MADYDAIVATTAATGASTPTVRYDGTIYAVPIPFENTQRISFVAENLAGAEVVNIYVWGGTKWAVFEDPAGNAAQLTATNKSFSTQAGLQFGVSKVETATACSVRYAYAPRQY